VVGITQALGDLGLRPELLANDPKVAMQGLLAGLYVAFDTTALALTLSMILMFMQFFVDRLETHLLSDVDERVSDELSGRFADEGGEAGPHLAAVRKMCTAVIHTAERLAHQQSQQWQHVMDEANSKWSGLLQSSGDQVREALTGALDQSVDRLASQLAQAERETGEHLRRRWEQWQTALSDNARLLHGQQTEMVRQAEVLKQVLQATGQVVRLEEALNKNLHALAGAQHFEETVMSLSAAIQLLSARLGPLHPAAVRLDSPETQGRAA
jgi:hypothetical protein